MRPSLRQLEYVVALANLRNFRQAAAACHVSQPALSKQIQTLESQLGVQLFERDRRRVLLTEAGAGVVTAARRVLVGVDELVEGANAHASPFAGTLRLGVIPTIASYFLPRAMPAIRDRFPDARLLLREGPTRELVERAESGGLDLLLVALEAELGGLETTTLFRDPFFLALPPRHPLARRKRMKEKDLHDEQVLLLEDGHCLRDQTLGLCDRAGACEVADFRATSLGTLVQMVAAGVGLTLLPSLAIEVERRSENNLVIRPFSAPAPFRTIGLAWRPSSPYRDHFEIVAEVLCRVAKGRVPESQARRPQR